MTVTDFVLRGDHIALDALLKASGVVVSGGAAKALIAGGDVRVNGEAEHRRGRKLRVGDEVTIGDLRIVVVAVTPDHAGGRLDRASIPTAD